MALRHLGFAVLVLVLAAVGSGPAHAVPGALSLIGQPASKRGVDNPATLTFGPDGRNVYVGSMDEESVGSLAVFARNPTNGALRQLFGRAGCATRRGSSGCAKAPSIPIVQNVVVSPDNRSVYVVGVHKTFPYDTVSLLARNRRTGVLTQPRGPAACLTTAKRAKCRRLRGLDGDTFLDFTLSPDARSAYVVGRNGIALLVRNPRTGLLTQPKGRRGCVGADRTKCMPQSALGGNLSLTLTRDGRFAYAASPSAVRAFERNVRSGALTPLPAGGCLSSAPRAGCIAPRGFTTGPPALFTPRRLILSPDERHAYVIGRDVSVFARDPATGTLSQLDGPAGCVVMAAEDDCTISAGQSLQLSPDGLSAFRWSGYGQADALHVLSRDPQSGALTPQGCLNGDASVGCTAVPGLVSAGTLLIPADGGNLYLETTRDTDDGYQSGLVALTRDPAVGAVGAIAGPPGCVGIVPRPGCLAAGELDAILGWSPFTGFATWNDYELSPDGRNLYVTSGAGDYILAFLRSPV